MHVLNENRGHWPASGYSLITMMMVKPVLAVEFWFIHKIRYCIALT